MPELLEYACFLLCYVLVCQGCGIKLLPHAHYLDLTSVVKISGYITKLMTQNLIQKWNKILTNSNFHMNLRMRFVLKGSLSH